MDRSEISSAVAEQFAIFKEEDYGKQLSVPPANRIHLARLVLSETTERPKSSPDSIELEENAQVCRHIVLFKFGVVSNPIILQIIIPWVTLYPEVKYVNEHINPD